MKLSPSTVFTNIRKNKAFDLEYANIRKFLNQILNKDEKNMQINKRKNCDQNIYIRFCYHPRLINIEFTQLFKLSAYADEK